MLQAIRYNLTERICTIRRSSTALRSFVALLVCTFYSGTLPASWLSSATASESPLDYQLKRQKMVVSQLESRAISNPLVLRAMTTVPRHLFVPSRLQRLAYVDGPLPIGHGQTISQPYIVAYMTEILHINQRHKVLEVGTGSGYQAAVLAELTDQVYTMEIIPELADTAAKRLKDMGYSSVNARQGDGYHGWPEAAPFDAIMVTAAAEFIPPPLLQQLKKGGRMIIPVGSPFSIQHLMLVEKKQEKITTRSLMPVRFVPFRRSQ